MGVIKKVLYRGEVLSKPRHRHLFLDMEENIHIHYRDFRIELSRSEFEDFSATFKAQSEELQQIIDERQYQDGVLPNSNLEETRIWTSSKLETEVKYHPNRLSLEECSDGFHLHYRHYKLLIDQGDFEALLDAFKGVDLKSGYAETYDEVLELLHANDLDFILASGNVPHTTLVIAVARHHLAKAKEIFKCIDFDAQENQDNKLCYQGRHLKVLIALDTQREVIEYQKMRGYNSVGRLVNYISKFNSFIDPDELNDLKAQVLDVFFGLRAGKVLYIEPNPQLWLYIPSERKVIFPYSSTAISGRSQADQLYRAWSSIINSLNLGFVKPTKKILAGDKQAQLIGMVSQVLLEQVAVKPVVKKIWLMGSTSRKQMGVYRSPFVHGVQIKLGSDVDILIELDENREHDIPSSWQLINKRSSNTCSVYHLAQLPLLEQYDEWQRKLPNCALIQHLIDAYIYSPSESDVDQKDDFLKKFNAQLFYSKERDGIHHEEEYKDLAIAVEENYGLENVQVEKMNVSTENELYKVFSGDQNLVLKLLKVSGNYGHERVNEHTIYEEQLVNQICEVGVETANVISGADGELVIIDGWPALMFERLTGVINKKPEYDIESAARSLSNIHSVQLKASLNLSEAFRFEETCKIWFDAFVDYSKRDFQNNIEPLFKKLQSIFQRFKSERKRSELLKTSPLVHNHGDVAPKNIMLTSDNVTCFFDFNNAFYGPRLLDVLDGAFEFSLAEKYPDLIDFSRFDQFIECYHSHSALNETEQEHLSDWIELMGLIKFTKEVRVLTSGDRSGLRAKRATAIAEFLLERN